MIISELLILQWIDKNYSIAERQKFIKLGLVSAADYQISTSEASDETEQLKNFIRLNLADLNELLLSLEEGYREALLSLDKGEIEDGKLRFTSVFDDTRRKFQEIDSETEELIGEFPIPEDREKKFLFNSYKEQWLKESQKKLKQIDDINEKFRIRSQFSVHLEDILRFEIENERAINDADIKTMKFPYQQAKQIIKFIEKPTNIRIGEISAEEKQKYGTLGRKIIETCSKNQITPNLPYLVIKFGITILEAKKILTYLHSVGMVEEIYLHYKK